MENSPAGIASSSGVYKISPPVDVMVQDILKIFDAPIDPATIRLPEYYYTLIGGDLFSGSYNTLANSFTFTGNYNKQFILTPIQFFTHILFGPDVHFVDVGTSKFFEFRRALRKWLSVPDMMDAEGELTLDVWKKLFSEAFHSIETIINNRANNPFDRDLGYRSWVDEMYSPYFSNGYFITDCLLGLVGDIKYNTQGQYARQKYAQSKYGPVIDEYLKLCRQMENASVKGLVSHLMPSCIVGFIYLLNWNRTKYVASSSAPKFENCFPSKKLIPFSVSNDGYDIITQDASQANTSTTVQCALWKGLFSGWKSLCSLCLSENYKSHYAHYDDMMTPKVNKLFGHEKLETVTSLIAPISSAFYQMYSISAKSITTVLKEYERVYKVTLEDIVEMLYNPGEEIEFDFGTHHIKFQVPSDATRETVFQSFVDFVEKLAPVPQLSIDSLMDDTVVLLVPFHNKPYWFPSKTAIFMSMLILKMNTTTLWNYPKSFRNSVAAYMTNNGAVLEDVMYNAKKVAKVTGVNVVAIDDTKFFNKVKIAYNNDASDIKVVPYTAFLGLLFSKQRLPDQLIKNHGSYDIFRKKIAPVHVDLEWQEPGISQLYYCWYLYTDLQDLKKKHIISENYDNVFFTRINKEYQFVAHFLKNPAPQDWNGDITNLLTEKKAKYKIDYNSVILDAIDVPNYNYVSNLYWCVLLAAYNNKKRHLNKAIQDLIFRPEITSAKPVLTVDDKGLVGGRYAQGYISCCIGPDFAKIPTLEFPNESFKATFLKLFNRHYAKIFSTNKYKQFLKQIYETHETILNAPDIEITTEWIDNASKVRENEETFAVWIPVLQDIVGSNLGKRIQLYAHISDTEPLTWQVPADSFNVAWQSFVDNVLNANALGLTTIDPTFSEQAILFPSLCGHEHFAKMFSFRPVELLAMLGSTMAAKVPRAKKTDIVALVWSLAAQSDLVNDPKLLDARRHVLCGNVLSTADAIVSYNEAGQIFVDGVATTSLQNVLYGKYQLLRSLVLAERDTELLPFLLEDNFQDCLEFAEIPEEYKTHYRKMTKDTVEGRLTIDLDLVWIGYDFSRSKKLSNAFLKTYNCGENTIQLQHPDLIAYNRLEPPDDEEQEALLLKESCQKILTSISKTFKSVSLAGKIKLPVHVDQKLSDIFAKPVPLIFQSDLQEEVLKLWNLKDFSAPDKWWQEADNVNFILSFANVCDDLYQRSDDDEAIRQFLITRFQTPWKIIFNKNVVYFDAKKGNMQIGANGGSGGSQFYGGRHLLRTAFLDIYRNKLQNIASNIYPPPGRIELIDENEDHKTKILSGLYEAEILFHNMSPRYDEALNFASAEEMAKVKHNFISKCITKIDAVLETVELPVEVGQLFKYKLTSPVKNAFQLVQLLKKHWKTQATQRFAWNQRIVVFSDSGSVNVDWKRRTFVYSDVEIIVDCWLKLNRIKVLPATINQFGQTIFTFFAILMQAWWEPNVAKMESYVKQANAVIRTPKIQSLLQQYSSPSLRAEIFKGRPRISNTSLTIEGHFYNLTKYPTHSEWMLQELGLSKDLVDRCSAAWTPEKTVWLSLQLDATKWVNLIEMENAKIVPRHIQDWRYFNLHPPSSERELENYGKREYEKIKLYLETGLVPQGRWLGSKWRNKGNPVDSPFQLLKLYQSADTTGYPLLETVFARMLQMSDLLPPVAEQLASLKLSLDSWRYPSWGSLWFDLIQSARNLSLPPSQLEGRERRRIYKSKAVQRTTSLAAPFITCTLATLGLTGLYVYNRERNLKRTRQQSIERELASQRTPYYYRPSKRSRTN